MASCKNNFLVLFMSNNTTSYWLSHSSSSLLLLNGRYVFMAWDRYTSSISSIC